MEGVGVGVETGTVSLAVPSVFLGRARRMRSICWVITTIEIQKITHTASKRMVLAMGHLIGGSPDTGVGSGFIRGT